MSICAPRYTSSVATTPKISTSTSQAAPVCEPANREFLPSRFGSWRHRITANVMMPAMTADREEVLQEPDPRPVPDAGDREASG